MTRRISRRTATLCVGAGTWLLLATQMVVADSSLSVPERLAAINDYVGGHTSYGVGGCQFASVDQEPADEFDDGSESYPGCSVCPSRWYARADYLLWWVQGNRLSPLVTTSLPQTLREDAGVLGRPGTSVLFGGQSVDDDLRHGVRLTLGRWLDDCQDWGVEGHYFYVGDPGGGYRAESAGDPILARPFFNLDPLVNGPDSQLVAFPGLVDGQIRVDTSSDLHSAGLLLRKTWLRGCQGQVALLGGYRYFRFRERLTIDEDLLVTDPLYIATVQVQDSFAVANDFHGADVGLSAELQRGRWSLDVLTKLGLGGVRQRLDISGRTQIAVPNEPPVVSNQGLLAKSSNIGRYSDPQFALLPELGLNVGYCVTPSLSLRAGYSLMWLTDALRTGDQIDAVIGDSAGAVHPQAYMETTSICVQGISLGGEWRR